MTVTASAGPKQILDDDLFVLEGLVVLEETPELAQDVVGQLRLVGDVGECGIVHADGDDLVVDAFLVAHPHHADRARLDDGQRVDRLLPQDERIERVAIVAKRTRDEAVVSRVMDGAVEHAIEPEETGSLSSSYLFLLPFGISTMTGNSVSTSVSST